MTYRTITIGTDATRAETVILDPVVTDLSQVTWYGWFGPDGQWHLLHEDET